MVEEQALSITRSCAVAKLSRAAYYRSQLDSAQRDGAVISALNEVGVKHQRSGFWKFFDRLRLLGYERVTAAPRSGRMTAIGLD